MTVKEIMKFLDEQGIKPSRQWEMAEPEEDLQITQVQVTISDIPCFNDKMVLIDADEVIFQFNINRSKSLGFENVSEIFVWQPNKEWVNEYTAKLKEYISGKTDTMPALHFSNWEVKEATSTAQIFAVFGVIINVFSGVSDVIFKPIFEKSKQFKENVVREMNPVLRTEMIERYARIIHKKMIIMAEAF